MLSSRQFSAGLKQFGRHREFCGEMVLYAVHHAILHGQKTPWNNLIAVVPRGLKQAMGATAPELDKKATEQTVAERAAKIVSKFWDEKAKKDKAVNTTGAGGDPLNPAPDAGGDPLNPAPPVSAPAPQGTTIDGTAVRVPTLCIIDEDGAAMEISREEYNRCMAIIMADRLASLKVAA